MTAVKCADAERGAMSEFRADRLKALRKRERLTQEELGERAGVNGSYISLLERRVKTNPSLTVIINLARALNTSPAYLMGQTDDPSPALFREVSVETNGEAPISERLLRHIRLLQEELGRLADEIAELQREQRERK